MTKAIILDFGSVIYKTEWKKINEYFSQKNGFDILIRNSEDTELIRIYSESDVGKEDFKKFFLRLKPDLQDIDAAVKDYKEGYSKFKIINKELLDIIKKLKEKGIRLFGFTDVKKEHYDSNMEAGIYEGFEEVFSSFEFGCLKSDPKAFELLTERLKEYDLKPEECLFIDDHPENIERASEKDYKTIHYQNFPEVEEIKKELEKIFVF